MERTLLLDPLWNTHWLQFVHDGGELNRFRKVEYVSRHPIAYDTLRVCWMNRLDLQNCCECEKCVRTMIHLQALDRLDRFSVFPRPLDLTRRPVMTLGPRSTLDYYQPVYYYLKDTGKHPELLPYLEYLLIPITGGNGAIGHYRGWHKRIKRGIRDAIQDTLVSHKR